MSYRITTTARFDPEGADWMSDGRRVRARAFVTVTPAVPAPATGAGSAPGIDPQLDAAWDAHNTSVITTQRAVLAGALVQLTGSTAHGIDVEFSRHAGCRACPCTPGWLLSAPVPVLVYGGEPAATVHVTA